MSQDLIEAGRASEPAIAQRSVALGHGANVGSIAIEQERAIAETQGKLIIAQRFPRSVAAATAEFLEACRSEAFAETAFYSVPNRGSGPSIRFAEEVARCYGNFDYGHRELSRSDGKSEVEVYAWDMEKNNFSRRQITIPHVIDTKNGPKACRDQSDVDNLIANKASKQVRGRILAVVSKAMVAAGIAECKKTLAGGNEKPVSERITAMASAFGKIGVTVDMLVEHLGHALDSTTIDELADMHGIYTAIKEGARVAEFFGAKDEPASDAAAALTAAGKDGDAAKPKETKAKAPPKQESEAAEGEKAPPPADEPKADAGEKPADPPKEEPKPADEPKAAEQPQQPANTGRREAVF